MILMIGCVDGFVIIGESSAVDRTRRRKQSRCIVGRLKEEANDSDPFADSSIFVGSSSSSSSSQRASTTERRTTSKASFHKKALKSFGRYLEITCWKYASLRTLEPVLTSIADASQQMSRIIQRAQTDDLYGTAAGGDGEENVQGEVQQKLDVLCNEILLKSFCASSSRAIAHVASEEEPLPRSCATVLQNGMFGQGDYVAVFDPLDGSKNIDASLPVGTIFGIYRKKQIINNNNNQKEDIVETFLQDGQGLVAAGYCLYSATTVLVLTLAGSDRVDGFTLDPDKGIFLQTHPNIRIPKSGSIYSVNEAYYRDFEKPFQNYLNAIKGDNDRPYPTARYAGALVADVHNVLMNGGLYAYPARTSQKQQNGKLRLLYESSPMAMILEQAGGAASTGRRRILDVIPNQIHERVPTFLGSIDNVRELEHYYHQYDQQQQEQEE